MDAERREEEGRDEEREKWVMGERWGNDVTSIGEGWGECCVTSLDCLLND